MPGQELGPVPEHEDEGFCWGTRKLHIPFRMAELQRVVRVLLGDLVQEEKVRVQATLKETSSSDERRDLIERTLRGLRAL